jgi:hypothetical protein
MCFVEKLTSLHHVPSYAGSFTVGNSQGGQRYYLTL